MTTTTTRPPATPANRTSAPATPEPATQPVQHEYIFTTVDRTANAVILREDNGWENSPAVAQARLCGNRMDLGLASRRRVQWLRGLTAEDVLYLRQLIDAAIQAAGWAVGRIGVN